MNKTILLIAGAVLAMLFSLPAEALTLQQAQNQLAGGHCAGNSCVWKADGSRTVQTVSATPSKSEGQSGFDNACAPFLDAEEVAPGLCQSVSIFNQGAYSGSNLVYGTDQQATCTTTTKTLKFHPGKPANKQWSIKTDNATADGTC